MGKGFGKICQRQFGWRKFLFFVGCHGLVYFISQIYDEYFEACKFSGVIFKKIVVIYHIGHIDHIDVLRLVGYVSYVHYVVNNYENK